MEGSPRGAYNARGPLAGGPHATSRMVHTSLLPLICHLPRCRESLWVCLRSPKCWFFFGLAGLLWFYSDVKLEMQPGSSNSSSLESNLDILISTPVIPKPESTGDIKCKWLDCGKSFAFLDDLASHVSTYHANSGPGGLFYCRWDGCSRGDRGFNARYKMLVHVRTHTNEKPHQCFQCNKSFSRAENLKIHARSHTGERPYVCPVPGCGKAYSNSSDRFKHTRTHSVHKPYVCKVPSCGKRYTDPSSLRKHVKTYRHFPTNIPLDENSPGRNLEEMKMDEENEEIVSKVDLEPMETSSPLRNQGNVDKTTSLSLTVLKKWLKSESMFRSFANSNKFPSNENCGYFQEQDIPLDLTVRK